jgi:hypothetical protein
VRISIIIRRADDDIRWCERDPTLDPTLSSLVGAKHLLILSFVTITIVTTTIRAISICTTTILTLATRITLTARTSLVAEEQIEGVPCGSARRCWLVLVGRGGLGGRTQLLARATQET